MSRIKKAFGLIVCMIIFAAMALGSGESSSGSSGTRSNPSDDGSAEEIKEETVAEEESTKGNSTVYIGDEFGNKTITGKVIYANLDYKDYDDMWVEVEEGYKAVFVKIKLVNVSEKSNYVSMGDFNFYADNISVDTELITGGDEDYNANIEAGRAAILGGLYIVPIDTKNIEIEYHPLGEIANRQIIIIQDENTTETIIEAENPDISTDSVTKDAVSVISIGDEFGNQTITGVVTEADIDYKGYNDVWTTINDGYKAIYIKIQVTNVSEESNYVSVGDFSCYVDDVIVDAELVSGGKEDYNANIDPGRAAILGAMYVIPADAGSIELEYDPFGETADRVIIKIQ